MEKLIAHFIEDPSLHAKWLNTLSYLENSGAKKIAKCQHKTLVKEEILKHAAEEFRHAWFLKKQSAKVFAPFKNYDPTNILGGFYTLHYLDRLEAKVCRYDKVHAYLLVTYAIELRAQSLYSLYQKLLKQKGSKVSVRPILIEEDEHLQEMLQALSDLQINPLFAVEIEEEIYKKWIVKLL